MYCSVEDIVRSMDEETLKNLTTNNSSEIEYDTDLINVKIDEQSRYIDSYLSGRYLLPITNTNDLKLLNPICVSLVIETIYSRRLLELPDVIFARKKAVINDLEKIQKGVITLYSASGSPAAEERASSRRTSKVQRYFTDETLRNY